MLDFTKKDAQIVKANKKLVDDLLSLNVNNRNAKKSHLAWLKKSIDEKEFILTGQGISVSNNGILIDGQHRLMAIKEAGYPSVELLLVTGLDEKSKVYVDQHTKRSTADMLKIVLNQEISTRMAAIVNFHLKIHETTDDFVWNKSKPSLDDVVTVTTEHAYIIDLIINAMGPMGRAGMLCALFHYAKKYDEDTALQLAGQVGIGENLKQDDAAYRVRGYIIGRGRKSVYGTSGQLEDYKNCVYGCIAHATGEKITRLIPAHTWKGLPERQRLKVVKAADAKKVA